MTHKLRRVAFAIALFCSAPLAFAGDFDGSKPLICATVDGHACDPGETCLRELPASLGVPQFMRIDFVNQTIAGPKRTTKIRLMDKTANQVMLQGSELGYAWTISLDAQDGTMTLALLSNEDAFVIFGNCTPAS
jgi:hypothetical protein